MMAFAAGVCTGVGILCLRRREVARRSPDPRKRRLSVSRASTDEAQVRSWSCGAENCRRRKFLVACSTMRESGDFPLDKLCQGRMDLIARCIREALIKSGAVRRNSVVSFTHEESGTAVTVDGAKAYGIRPDERSICMLLRRSLWSACGNVKEGSEYGDVTKSQLRSYRRRKRDGKPEMSGENVGITVRRPQAAEALLRFELRRLQEADDGKTHLIVLHEEGESVETFVSQQRTRSIDDKCSFTVLLGDHRGFTSRELEDFRKMGASVLSLGMSKLLTSQCITIMHHYLDKVHVCDERKNSCKSSRRKVMEKRQTGDTDADRALFECKECCQSLRRQYFSKTQLGKRGYRVCAACLKERDKNLARTASSRRKISVKTRKMKRVDSMTN